ncbi:hypothetical protein, partial [Ensifer sp. NM-2]|uniref:hypothetical protein n=1 Tax=Ensifer sp. NM-2 TaxID=2109730 RepID=UPI001AEC79B8
MTADIAEGAGIFLDRFRDEFKAGRIGFRMAGKGGGAASDSGLVDCGWPHAGYENTSIGFEAPVVAQETMLGVKSLDVVEIGFTEIGEGKKFVRNRVLHGRTFGDDNMIERVFFLNPSTNF